MPAGPGAARGLRLVAAQDGERRAVLEALIRRRFAERYQARVRHFMPCLLGLEAPDGSLHGAVGCRRADGQPLFLERYLDLPIEQAIAQRCGRSVERREIVEVGNLAADGRGAARRLIVSLTQLLAASGLRWVAFTGTPALLNSFVRLGLSPCAIAPADPARVGGELADWGSYYEHRPQVMVGEILGGHRRLAQQGAYAGALESAGFHHALEMSHVAGH